MRNVNNESKSLQHRNYHTACDLSFGTLFKLVFKCTCGQESKSEQGTVVNENEKEKPCVTIETDA
jgi:hypothetical protein